MVGLEVLEATFNSTKQQLFIVIVVTLSRSTYQQKGHRLEQLLILAPR